MSEMMTTDVDTALIDAARAVLGKFALEVDYTAGGVASALRTRNGHVYTGICLDLACGIGFCAEHAAVAEMLKHRETAIESVVALREDTVLPPCGRCRELLLQIDKSNLDTRVIMPKERVVPLRELLPDHWRDAIGA